MANSWYHAVSSARRFGGTPEQYLPVHDWFDASKELHGDFRHRALRHHAHGVFEAQRVFGPTLQITLEDGSARRVPTRSVAEQHVIEDHGFIPSLGDWLKEIRPQRWMQNARPLSRELEGQRAPSG